MENLGCSIERIFEHEIKQKSDEALEGIAYFEQFLPELQSYDFVEIFVELTAENHFLIGEVEAFLLSTPLLWQELQYSDWLKVLSSLNPRPKPYTREIYDCGYFDIQFLCKYLQVDGIEFFLQQTSFSQEV